jgi:hypothetical protein
MFVAVPVPVIFGTRDARCVARLMSRGLSNDSQRSDALGAFDSAAITGITAIEAIGSA